MNTDAVASFPPVPDREVMVSIVCITYNQEAYLAQALESFVTQETTFPIEIIVHDDASTDGTAAILRSYQERYPELFVCFYQQVNQYSQGVHIWADITFPKARGKYIALCEGDDYWTDPRKLQKQVEMLESNPGYSICFHNAEIVYEDRGTSGGPFCKGIMDGQAFTTRDLILKNWFIPTASVLFRKSALPEFPAWAFKGYNWDFTLQLLLSTRGDAVYLDQVMGVYRKNAINSLSTVKRSLSFYRNKLIALLLNFNRTTKYRYCLIVYFRVIDFHRQTMRDVLYSKIYNRGR